MFPFASVGNLHSRPLCRFRNGSKYLHVRVCLGELARSQRFGYRLCLWNWCSHSSRRHLSVKPGSLPGCPSASRPRCHLHPSTTGACSVNATIILPDLRLQQFLLTFPPLAPNLPHAPRGLSTSPFTGFAAFVAPPFLLTAAAHYWGSMFSVKAASQENAACGKRAYKRTICL